MNLYDYLMSIGFYYSDNIFKLCYDKFIRPDLYNKIINTKSQQLLSEDPTPYLNIKWLSENDLNKINIEEGCSVRDSKAINYMKNSIQLFKIYGLFFGINVFTLSTFLINYKNIKKDSIRGKYYKYFMLFVIFIQTPYLIIGAINNQQKVVEEMFKNELDKINMFYQI